MALAVSAITPQSSAVQASQPQPQRPKQSSRPASGASQQVAGARPVPSPAAAAGNANPLTSRSVTSRPTPPDLQRAPAPQPAAQQRSQAAQQQKSSQPTAYPSIDIRA